MAAATGTHPAIYWHLKQIYQKLPISRHDLVRLVLSIAEFRSGAPTPPGGDGCTFPWAPSIHAHRTTRPAAFFLCSHSRYFLATTNPGSDWKVLKALALAVLQLWPLAKAGGQTQPLRASTPASPSLKSPKPTSSSAGRTLASRVWPVFRNRPARGRAEFVERQCWRLEKLAYRTPLEAREYELRHGVATPRNRVPR